MCAKERMSSARERINKWKQILATQCADRRKQLQLQLLCIDAIDNLIEMFLANAKRFTKLLEKIEHLKGASLEHVPTLTENTTSNTTWEEYV